MKKSFLMLLFAMAAIFAFTNYALAGWSAQTSGSASDFEKISFATNQIGIAFGSALELPSVKTINGGTTWIDANAPGDEGIDTYYNSEDEKTYAVYTTSGLSAGYFYSNDLANSTEWGGTSKSWSFCYGIKMLNSVTSYMVGGAPTTAVFRAIYGVSFTSFTNVDSLTEILRAVDCATDDICYAVGDNGTIVFVDGTSDAFSNLSIGGEAELRDISVVGLAEAYVAGDSGTIVKFNGSTWTPSTIEGAGNLYGISCPETQTCWAVGAGGKIYKTTNGASSWEEETSGVETDLNSVDFYDTNHGWASGNGGVILGYVGDETGPTVNINFPASTYYNSSSWSAISGTSTDEVEVSSTTLTIKRDSDSKYWDGDSWEIASTNLSTSGTPTDWSYTLSSDNLTDGGYAIVVTSTDTSTNTGTDSVNFTYDNTAPVTVASPSGGTYASAQSVTLTATDSGSGVTATYYTTDGSTPTTSSTAYTSPIDIAETNALKFFSVDTTGNSESIKTEEYVIETTPPAPPVIPFNHKLNLKDVQTNQIYYSAKTNTRLIFFALPSFQNRQDLYIKVKRIKYKYLPGFKKSRTYPDYIKLTSNIKKAKNKHQRIKFRLKINYSKKKLKANINLKPKKIRVYHKDTLSDWYGPYNTYQNQPIHRLRVSLQNYHRPQSLAASTKVLYFPSLQKIKFVLAGKNILKPID